MQLMERPEGTRRLDDRGRITIERNLRKFIEGQRLVQVATPEGILLRPAVDTIRLGPDAASSVREAAMAAAMEEIDEELREIHGIDPDTGKRIPGWQPPEP